MNVAIWAVIIASILCGGGDNRCSTHVATDSITSTQRECAARVEWLKGHEGDDMLVDLHMLSHVPHWYACANVSTDHAKG